MFDLTGKKALVTGSSRGIGKAFALALAEQGADVAVHYVTSEKEACAVRDDIISMGRQSIAIQADMENENCAEVIFSQLETFGDIDILVLNAAIDCRNSWENITPTEFSQQINCNFRSSLLMCQKAVPYMKKKQWGRIVTLGSVQQNKPNPQLLVYSSAKAAQAHMVHSLALQLCQYGITVNNIAPGIINTDRNTLVLSDPAYRDACLAKVPMSRFGEPEECAGALILLCSDEGGYITGQSLFVDGGMGIK